MISRDMQADLMRSGLNLIGQAISIFDANLRLAVANRAFQVMFDFPDWLTRPGATFEDVIRFQVERGDYGPQADNDEAVRMRVDQARTFQPHYMERTRANGRTISVEGSPLQHGGWIAVYTDITEIRRQEALLRARSEELSEQVLSHAERLSAANRELAATVIALEEAKRVLTEAEARTRHVTEMVPAHIAHVDEQYRYTFSNNQLAQVMPGTPAWVLGHTCDEVLGTETFARIRPHMDIALAGQAQVFEITHAPSGRRIRIALTPDPNTENGRGVYVLSADVTAEVQAREALTHTAKRELAAKMTSGLAHDFGNLLTIIMGLQGRLAKAGLTGDAADQVQATLAAAHRGGALLDRIAAITGPRELTRQPVDLAALLNELAAMARPTLGEGVELRLDLKIPPGPALLAAGPLQDSLLNLILNARDAMAGQGRIRLGAQILGNWLELSVSDTGPGFAPEALTRATEPFFTTKGGQGSGLGLSMVYDHTKLAGGTMRLDNTAQGARVRLRLPWLPFTPTPPMLILLAEDDGDIRTHVREMLTGLGHSVIEAATAAEARELTDLPGLGLILSDIQLGDATGMDLLAGADVPGVLMTSLPEGDARRVGTAYPILTKPFDVAELAAFLAQTCQASAAHD